MLNKYKKTYVNSSSIAFTEAKNYTVYVKYVGDDRAENINKYAFANVTAKADSLVDISVAFNNFTVAEDFDYSTEEKYADIDSKITVKGVYASKEETSALTAWEDYRITPDIYHTLIIDKEFRIYKEDNNGVVTENNNFENIDILSSFDDFVDLDIVIDEKSKNYNALLNNFLKLKHIIDHIKSQRKENTNNRQYIKLFDIKNKRDDN